MDGMSRFPVTWGFCPVVLYRLVLSCLDVFPKETSRVPDGTDPTFPTNGEVRLASTVQWT